MEDSCATLVNSALTNALSAVFAASPAGVGNGSVELHDDGGARGAVRLGGGEGEGEEDDGGDLARLTGSDLQISRLDGQNPKPHSRLFAYWTSGSPCVNKGTAVRTHDTLFMHTKH